MEKKGKHYVCLGGSVKLLHLVWKSVQRFFRKMRKDLPQAPTIPFLSIYAKDSVSHHRDTYSFMILQIYSQSPEVEKSLDVQQLINEQ